MARSPLPEYCEIIEMQSTLRHILQQVCIASNSDFSGIGLVIYDRIDAIPITHLRLTKPNLDSELIPLLIEISSNANEFHDGFHLINTEWRLTHVAQYFSPPIDNDVSINRNRPIGGRYVAALFGSVVQGVRMCGIASKDFGIAIFQEGKEIYYEAPQ